MKNKTLALLLPVLAAIGALPTEIMSPKAETKERNKYNLSEEEIERMASMTPKDKKKFLRSKK